MLSAGCQCSSTQLSSSFSLPFSIMEVQKTSTSMLLHMSIKKQSHVQTSFSFSFSPRRRSSSTGSCTNTRHGQVFHHCLYPPKMRWTSASFALSNRTLVSIVLTTSVMFKIFLVIASLSLCGVGVNQSFWNVSFTNFQGKKKEKKPSQLLTTKMANFNCKFPLRPNKKLQLKNRFSGVYYKFIHDSNDQLISQIMNFFKLVMMGNTMFNLQLLHKILSKFFKHIFMYVCLCRCALPSACRSQRRCWILWSQSAGGCEPPGMGAGN